MQVYNKYKDTWLENRTLINQPIITTDFYENIGVKIKVGNEWKDHLKYIHTIKFYSQKEYDDYVYQFLSASNLKKT